MRCVYLRLADSTPIMRQFYFYCIISNFFFRFFWAVTITPVPIDIGMNPEMLNLVAASIEIIRY